MASLDSVLRTALEKITPTPGEEKETQAVVREVERAVRANIGKLSHTLAGSFVRNTWMRDKKEFDIFILFPESTTRQALEKKGLELGKGIVRSLKGSWIVAYAEHPYTRASYKGFAIDLVPCYKISDPSRIKSAVDRTPFHNQYLTARFSANLSGEVRLLKRFLKNSGLYGSDSKTQGFSGYLCELLILHYKSFKTLVKEGGSWSPGEVVVDLELHHPVRPLFPRQPLVVIDPVDPKRNVAAVLSSQNFLRFAALCRRFSSRPSLEFFFRKPARPDPRKLSSLFKSRKTLFLGVEFKNPGVIEDILYPQLRKTIQRVASLLREQEFLVLGTEVFTDKKTCLLLFEMEAWELPLVRKLVGPPVFVKKHAQEFLHKYQEGRLWVEGECWVAEVKRKFPRAEEFLKQALKGSPKALQERGIPSYPARSLQKGFRLLTPQELLGRAKNQDFSSFLQDYLERRIEV